MEYALFMSLFPLVLCEEKKAEVKECFHTLRRLLLLCSKASCCATRDLTDSVFAHTLRIAKKE